MKKNITEKLEYGIDEPLENPELDCLDRAVFARRIFNTIKGTPETSNITIGIYGSWGSGKTTTMNFLKYYCKQDGHPVASYNPWQFRNREDAWKGFVSSIDKGIAIWQGKSIGSLKRQSAVKKASKKTRELAATTSVGRVIGSLVLKPLEGLLEQTKQKVQCEIDKALKDKRLFVFIDDLDRAEPEVLYDHLMLLNEIVDLKRCIYIIGLDVDVASKVIENKIRSIDSKGFLDKIVNWQFALPEPTDFEWHELLDNEVKKLDKNIKKDALLSIFAYLPKNPRKFKHFLSYISALHKSFLDRFDEYELNWKVLYLAQLLRIEFPEIFKKIIDSKKILEDLLSGIFTDRLTESSHTLQENQSPEWLQRIDEISKDLIDIKKEKLRVLYKSLRESAGVLLTEQLINHLLVVENPELFTWKEYNEFKKELLSLVNHEIIGKLKNFIEKANKDKQIERVREFFKMLLRDRNLLLSQAADSIDEEEMRSLINRAKDIMKICFAVLDVEDIFNGHNPLFNVEVFKEWYKNIVEWAHFTHPRELYSEIRQLESDLAKKLAYKASLQTSLIFDSLLDRREAFELTHNEVKGILEKALAEEILDRFRRIDGIRELYGTDNRSFRHEKYLLFRLNTAFHNENVYKQLRNIAQESSNNPNIQKNFYEYANMFFYAALKHLDCTEKDEVINLLKEKEFMNIVWEAVVSRRMNLRSVGSLEQQRVKIKQVLGDENALPVPDWWTKMLSEVKEKI